MCLLKDMVLIIEILGYFIVGYGLGLFCMEEV